MGFSSIYFLRSHFPTFIFCMHLPSRFFFALWCLWSNDLYSAWVYYCWAGQLSLWCHFSFLFCKERFVKCVFAILMYVLALQTQWKKPVCYAVQSRQSWIAFAWNLCKLQFFFFADDVMLVSIQLVAMACFKFRLRYCIFSQLCWTELSVRQVSMVPLCSLQRETIVSNFY